MHNSVDSMENSKKFRPDPKLRLMDQVRKVLNIVTLTIVGLGMAALMVFYFLISAEGAL